MRLFNKQSGFTLVELIVAIAIAAILAAIAVPNFLPYMPKHRLNGAARQVVVDLMATRMQAVKENNEFKVFFPDDSPGNQYTILDDDNNNGYIDSGERTIIKNIQSNYPDVILEATNNPIFHPRGNADPTATITLTSLTDSTKTKEIRVAITGRVRIEK